MSVKELEFILQNPPQPPMGTVIWLHGLGADGHDFADIVPQLNLPPSLHLRFIFPHAPVRAVAINAGMRMRAWYDIYSLNSLDQEDEAGIQHSFNLVDQLIQQEISRGIPSERIILAGFSQGGAIALYTALRYPQQLAGVIALSTYLPLSHKASNEKQTCNAHMPIFMAHGVDDPILPIQLAELSLAILRDENYLVEWHTYSMAHSVCMPEIAAIQHWLCERFCGER